MSQVDIQVCNDHPLNNDAKYNILDNTESSNWFKFKWANKCKY